VVATYDSATVAEARAVIAHGIERRVPLLTLTGKAGAGTSAVLRSLRERFGAEFDLALPTEPPASVAELAVVVLRLLGRPFIDAPPLELLRIVGDALEPRADSPRPLALLLDDAEGLCDDVLEALALFGAPADSERARLAIVLAGRPGLLARLSAPRLAALRRGLTIDVRLHTARPTIRPADPAPSHPPRRSRRRRTLVVASLVACLCAATALYLDPSLPETIPLPGPPPFLPVPRARPSALAALVVPRTADAALPPALDDGASVPLGEQARRLVARFQEALARGDGEAIRTVLDRDVRYNGDIGIDAALEDQIWFSRGEDRPRFLPPDAARADAGTVRVEGRFLVPYRDVAGIRGEVTGRALWYVAAHAGGLRIVQVEYDIIPSPPPPSPGG
jgi:hypothetical protein